MDNEFAKHELDYIRQYEAKGYTAQYRLVDYRLEDVDSKKRYAPEDVTIFKEHRYEGMSDPSDMSLLYVLETNDGGKGTLLANYGPEADTSVHEFMNEIPKENVKSDTETPPDAE
ncbi:MAG: hypothetical protein ACSHXF_10395 [Aquaticitalea sp.]